MSNVTQSPTVEDADDLSPGEIFLRVMFQVILCLFVAMMTASVSKETLSSKYRSKGVLVGLLVQFFLSPLIGLLTVNIPAFDDALTTEDKIVLLAVMSSPGGTFSNLLCSLFNADLGLSVSMSAISTLASAVFLPFNMFVYVSKGFDEDVQIDFVELSYTIIAVEVGVALGVFINYKVGDRSLQQRFNLAGCILGIIILVISISLSQSEEGFFENGGTFIIACIFPVAVSGIVAIILASFAQIEKPERLAVAVESAYQNTAIAVSVAFATFPLEDARKAINVTVVNGLGQYLVSHVILIIGWKAGWSYAPKGTSFCQAFVGNYQPLNGEEQKKLLNRTISSESVKATSSDELRIESTEKISI